MTKKTEGVDPFEVLSSAYETMYERAADKIHKVHDKTDVLMHEYIDEAKHKAVELDELTEEDAEKLSSWLKRDIDDAINHMSEADSKFVDWLGFKTELLESTFLQMLLDTADPTTVELKQLKERAEHPHEYHTGEIAGPGTLICDECGEKLHFYKAGKIPPCPKCHETKYHR